MINSKRLKEIINERYAVEPNYSARLSRLEKDTGILVANIQRVLRVKNCSIKNLLIICRALNIKADDILIMEDINHA